MSALPFQSSGPNTEHPAQHPRRLGLLGGTFNPIHNGHLTIARATREALGLDRILFVPTGDPPHKSPHGLAPAAHRYEMVRLAIASDPTFDISDVELRREGKSYSIDTVREVQQMYGTNTELFFLIGLDAFLDFTTWREPKTLLNSCSFVVISRPGLSFQSLASMALLPSLPLPPLADMDAGRRSRLDIEIGLQQLTCLRLPPSDISASDIRHRIREKKSVANLLPPSVESYILRYHLYE